MNAPSTTKTTTSRPTPTTYWRQHDLARQAKDSDTPLFFTQGFIESNTTRQAMQEYLAGHRGTERGWLGQWDHVRGNERTEDRRRQMRRAGWFKEVMSCYDQQLKGTEPTTAHPAFAIQDSTGSWHSHDTWPLVDRSADVPLRDGSYVDRGKPGDSASFLTWSEPIGRDVRVTGAPRVRMDTEGERSPYLDTYLKMFTTKELPTQAPSFTVPAARD